MSDHVGGSVHQQVLREHGSHPLRVKAIVDETGDTRSFVLDVPDELGPTFTYRPGQFCTFRARVGGDELWRSYSMSSTPGLDADLTVTVKRVPDGLVSNWFNDAVNVGDVLDLTKPAGVFCPTERDVPVVAFCGGSGITPVFSIVKHLLATTDRAVTLLYANRDRESVIFGTALGQLQARYPGRFELRTHFDSDRGYLGRGDIITFVASGDDADYYICGPTPFMDLVETTLHDAGVDPAHIAIERFLVGGAGERPADPDVAEVADAAVATASEITLILRRKKATVPYRAGDTILETARRGGLQPPFSCEAGNCATCMAFLREGAAEMRVNNALTAEEIAEGWILTCQALPTSATVTVEYEAL